jgi:hypothetical protein
VEGRRRYDIHEPLPLTGAAEPRDGPEATSGLFNFLFFFSFFFQKEQDDQ